MINTNLYIEDMYHTYDSREKIYKFYLDKVYTYFGVMQCLGNEKR